MVRVRDACQAVVTRVDAAAATIGRRGYEEVDPLRPWETWQAIRGRGEEPA